MREYTAPIMVAVVLIAGAGVIILAWRRGAFVERETGQDTIEYALMGVLVAVVVVGLCVLFGGQIQSGYHAVVHGLQGGGQGGSADTTATPSTPGP